MVGVGALKVGDFVLHSHLDSSGRNSCQVAHKRGRHVGALAVGDFISSQPPRFKWHHVEISTCALCAVYAYHVLCSASVLLLKQHALFLCVRRSFALLGFL